MIEPMEPDTERAAWAALVDSAGWQLLVGHCNAEFGANASLQRILAWAGKIGPGQDAAQKESVLVEAGKRDALMWLMRMPEQRIKALDAAADAAHKAEEQGIPRRGGYR